MLVLGALLWSLTACQPQLVGSSLLRPTLPASSGNDQVKRAPQRSTSMTTELAKSASQLAVAANSALTATVMAYESSVVLPTYPYERYQTAEFDPVYRWPYQKFDVERFRAEAPKPTPRTYRLLILENAYLRVLILPELGGRLWQIIHKPSGKPIFYQNSVVKPTHWGQANQLGWLALGGLEWGLPVIEHGYDWGVAWEVKTVEADDHHAAVTVCTPRDGRLLNACITVALYPQLAQVEIQPTLTNLSTNGLTFSFWQDAMLAPGSGQHPSAQFHFVLPSQQMQVHSTNDALMPAPQQTFTWPRYLGRDLSRLGNWQQYLGFFESPAAHGPFVGVYDPAYDMGAVRVFPPEVARGSKVFALGWQDALGSDNYTDDDSMYVELHGGLATSFFDQAHLPPGGVVTWRELWYPVQGLGDLTYANEAAALALAYTTKGIQLALYPTQAITGALILEVPGNRQQYQPITLQPATPFTNWLPLATEQQGPITIRLLNQHGQTLLTYTADK